MPGADNPPLPSGPQRATAPPAIPAPPARQLAPQPDAARTQATAKPTGPPSAADTAAYQALDASARRRARELAARPDVKALLRLRDEVKQRDNELGHRRADLIERAAARSGPVYGRSTCAPAGVGSAGVLEESVERSNCSGVRNVRGSVTTTAEAARIARGVRKKLPTRRTSAFSAVDVPFTRS